MSLRAIDWALRQKIDVPAAKLLLIALCEYADRDTNVCWPSIKSLAQTVCISERSIQRHLRALNDAGYITTQPRTGSNGRQTTNAYRIMMDGCHGDGGGRHDDGGGGAMDGGGFHEPVRNNNTPQTPQGDFGPDPKFDLKPEGEIDPPENKSADPVDEAFEVFWKAFPPGRKQAKVKARQKFRRIVTGRDRELKATAQELIDGARRYAAAQAGNRKYTAMPITWLNQGRWQDEDVGAPADAKPAPQLSSYRQTQLRKVSPQAWRERLKWLEDNRRSWPDHLWGPAPGQPGSFCRLEDAAEGAGA